MSKGLKKATVKAPKGIHPYKVRFGSRQQLGETRSYPTGPKAKQAIIKELDRWKPWCLRYNTAGLAAIADAAGECDAMIFHSSPARIECCFDEHTDMWLVAEYWQEP
jgi:hypothetical protein